MFGYVFEPTDIALFFTLLLLEGVLSFDNAAVLAALVLRLPREERQKALLYGLVGAYAFRITAILGVAFIIRNPALKAVGGAYLVFLMVRHLLAHGDGTAAKAPSFFGLRGFWGVVVAVELADIAFALDQVLVAVAMTNKLFIIVLASMVGILFLRIAAAYMARIMEWFPQLETLAYVAVGFVGFKLIAIEALHRLGHPEFEIPEWVSITVTLSLLVAPPVVKLLVERFGAAKRTA